MDPLKMVRFAQWAKNHELRVCTETFGSKWDLTGLVTEATDEVITLDIGGDELRHVFVNRIRWIGLDPEQEDFSAMVPRTSQE